MYYPLILMLKRFNVKKKHQNMREIQLNSYMNEIKESGNIDQLSFFTKMRGFTNYYFQ